MPCIVSLPPHSSYHPYSPSLSTFRTTSLRSLRGELQNCHKLPTSRTDMNFSASSTTVPVKVDGNKSISRAASLVPSSFPLDSSAVSPSPLIGNTAEAALQHSIPSMAICSDILVQCPSSSIATSTPNLLDLTKPKFDLSLKLAGRTSAPLERRSLDLSSTVGPSLTTRSVISYLKAWRPPIEYYARRRHHPSLTHPSRRPMLPALLEEQLMPEGHLGLVRPELVIRTTGCGRTTPRSSCQCSPCREFLNLGSGWSSMRMLELRAWEDESDEDDVREDDSDDQLSEEDDDDDDDDYWSESEIAEAVTPVSSPGSPSGFILQPLFLTKPPGC